MYVGGMPEGVLEMTLEVIGNAYDLHLAGACSRIHVEVDGDDVVTVRDDGPGIPAPILETLTVLHDRATRDGHRPHCHLGPGIGLAPVVALSDQFTAIVVRDGMEHVATYRRGEAVGPVARTSSDGAPGTTIRFGAAAAVLGGRRVPRVALAIRLHELAHLAPALGLSWSFGPDPGAARGVVGLLEMLADTGPVAHRRSRVDDIDVDVAVGWRRQLHGSEPPVLRSFVNFRPTRDGTHVRGLEQALGVLGARPRARLQRGLVAVVSVVLSDVQFGAPTRDELLTGAAGPAVRRVAEDALAAWQDAHPDERVRILERTRAR